jgi:hypothetical protein
MRTLFGHGTPRQTADAALAGLLAGLQIAFRIALWKMIDSLEPFLGMLLPPATEHRRAPALAV